MKFSKPRGTRDHLPDEMEARRAVERSLRSSFERFGYREVMTPSFEHLELITAKSGEEINEHLYSFKDKSERLLTLRPELSAPTIRLYVNELRNRPKPRKLYYFENCFRYERPQKGRYREFWQAGVELIGSKQPEAEAEVITLAVTALEDLGIRDYNLTIGHLGIIRSFLKSNGVDEKLQNNIISILDKGTIGELKELNIPESVTNRLIELINLKGKKEAVQSKLGDFFEGNETRELKNFMKLLERVDHFNRARYTVDIGVARGLDYYTGMVFEIRAKGLGAQDQICGGGTYSLVKLMGGGDISSCGFAFGFDRLMLALSSKGEFSTRKIIPKVFVVPESRKVLNRAINIVSVLRNTISCDLELMGRKLDKSMSYADSEGIPYVLIVSEKAEGDYVVLRDMNTGAQKEIRLSEVPDAVG